MSVTGGGQAVRITSVVTSDATSRPGAAEPFEVPTPSPMPHRYVERVVDSGDVRNRGEEGMSTVFSEVVRVEGATSLRLFFDRLGVGSDEARAADPHGRDARIRITSLEDGAVQIHTPETLARWLHSSAFFNGDSVRVELEARAGAPHSRVRVFEVMAGERDKTEKTICGALDDRVLSTDPRVARITPVGCTAWLIDDAQGCFLTAGHCVGAGMAVVEFNVPLSDADGTNNHPSPEHQYPVDVASIQSDLTVIGNDWSYFGTQPSGGSERTAIETQGAAFSLGTPPVAVTGQMIRITGHGSTTGTQGTPLTWNQVQHTHVGPLAAVSGTVLRYATDTTGGDSGSPVIEESTGDPVGIHTNGGCGPGGGSNSGTSLANTGLQTALANPIGVCSDGPPQLRVLLSGSLPDPMPTSGGAFQVNVVDRNDTPVAATSATLVYDSGGGDQSVAMTNPALGTYDATFPDLACGAEVVFRADVVAPGGATVRHPFSPQNSADRRYRRWVAQGYDRTFHDDFETDQGWTVTGTAAAGVWERGLGAGYGFRGDPPWDADASGQAFYTDPHGGNTDVDGGTTTLTSPQLDASAAEAHLSYWRWWDDQGSAPEALDDSMTVEISNNDGTTWTPVETIGPNVAGAWVYRHTRVADFVAPSNQVRIRFTTLDEGEASIIEAAIDGVSVSNTETGLLCTDIFSDGFESGNTTVWSSSTPP